MLLDKILDLRSLSLAILRNFFATNPEIIVITSEELIKLYGKFWDKYNKQDKFTPYVIRDREKYKEKYGVKVGEKKYNKALENMMEVISSKVNYGTIVVIPSIGLTQKNKILQSYLKEIFERNVTLIYPNTIKPYQSGMNVEIVVSNIVLENKIRTFTISSGTNDYIQQRVFESCMEMARAKQAENFEYLQQVDDIVDKSIFSVVLILLGMFIYKIIKARKLAPPNTNIENNPNANVLAKILKYREDREKLLEEEKRRKKPRHEQQTYHKVVQNIYPLDDGVITPRWESGTKPYRSKETPRVVSNTESSQRKDSLAKQTKSSKDIEVILNPIYSLKTTELLEIIKTLQSRKTLKDKKFEDNIRERLDRLGKIDALITCILDTDNINAILEFIRKSIEEKSRTMLSEINDNDLELIKSFLESYQKSQLRYKNKAEVKALLAKLNIVNKMPDGTVIVEIPTTDKNQHHRVALPNGQTGSMTGQSAGKKHTNSGGQGTICIEFFRDLKNALDAILITVEMLDEVIAEKAQQKQKVKSICS